MLTNTLIHRALEKYNEVTYYINCSYSNFGMLTTVQPFNLPFIINSAHIVEEAQTYLQAYESVLIVTVAVKKPPVAYKKEKHLYTIVQTKDVCSLLNMALQDIVTLPQTDTKLTGVASELLLLKDFGVNRVCVKTLNTYINEIKKLWKTDYPYRSKLLAREY